MTNTEIFKKWFCIIGPQSVGPQSAGVVVTNNIIRAAAIQHSPINAINYQIIIIIRIDRKLEFISRWIISPLMLLSSENGSNLQMNVVN